MQENNPIKQAFPEQSITDSIRQQAQAQATQVYGRHRQRVRTRNAILGSMATVGVVFGTLVIGPKANAYYRIQRIAGSVNDCTSAILDQFIIEKDGTVRPNGKVTFSNGQWRIERDGELQIYDQGKLWMEDRQNRRVVVKMQPEGPFGFNPSGFSIHSIISDYKRWQWNDNMSIQDEVVDGRQVEVLVIEKKEAFALRTKVYADPETHMPFRITGDKWENGKWRPCQLINLSFNKVIDPKLFSIKFPKELRLVNLDTIKQDWAAKLETPIATLTSKSSKVVIRDYFISKRGHIFVIFTDGETVKDREEYAKAMRAATPPTTYHHVPKFALRDSSGVEYLLSERFQPYMNSVGSQRNQWIALKDGQVLQGAWLVPTKPVTWQPKTLTFSFSAYIDPYNDESSSSWTIEVPKPVTGLLPDWVDVCARAPHNEKDVLDEEYNVHLVPEMMVIDPKTGKPKSNIIKYKYGR